MDFKEIRPEELSGNVFNMIANDWMLITAEKDGDVNTMTASWGGLGFIWRKPVAYIFIRPQRYTYQFMEREPYFTVSVLDSGREDAYRICGLYRHLQQAEGIRNRDRGLVELLSAARLHGR